VFCHVNRGPLPDTNKSKGQFKSMDLAASRVTLHSCAKFLRVNTGDDRLSEAAAHIRVQIRLDLDQKRGGTLMTIAQVIMLVCMTRTILVALLLCRPTFRKDAPLLKIANRPRRGAEI
jgi:hypothetical protein